MVDPLGQRAFSAWFSLDAASPLNEQIYRALRDALLGGRLPPGARLPSSRALADTLGVSRNTVIAAYGQLSAEGYLSTRHGSGSFVADALPAEALSDPEPRAPGSHRAPSLPLPRFITRIDEEGIGAHFRALGKLAPVRYDFAYGRPDARLVPLELWRRALGRALRHGQASIASYGHAGGSDALKHEIALHVARRRGLDCTAKDVLIVAGTQEALALSARVVIEPGAVAAIEDPHYLAARDVLLAQGARVAGVRVDDEGLDPARLPQDAHFVHVTPSHQFPTGSVMSAPRRIALLEWAERRGAVVFEDDYDSEFRFEGRAIQALAGLDTSGRVIYAGSFSKTLFPGLRLGYVIAKNPLLRRLVMAKWLASWSSPVLEQEALALLMADGDYDRHLRRMRTAYGARREVLLKAALAHLGGRVEPSGEQAGLHVVLWLHNQSARFERRLAETARRHGVGVYPVSPQYLEAPRAGLLLGYGALDEREIRAGMRRLAAAFDEATRAEA